MDAPELHALLYILRAADPPAPAVHDFVATCGVVAAVGAIRSGNAPPAVMAEVSRPDADIGPGLEALDRGVVRLVAPGDPEWPGERLATLAEAGMVPPLGLWVRGGGALAALTWSAVTITGSRAATGYGQYVASDFGCGFAEAGVTVVGGGSYGIEGAAHRGALTADGHTVVVMPCGLDRPYPTGHIGLLESVVERGGLLVSEYPPGVVPARGRFLARCRLLVALSGATVVVEAGRHCLSLQASKVAAALGRRVYGVPGPITSVTSAGVHQLLRDGQARLAAGVVDVEHDVVGHPAVVDPEAEQ